MLFCHDQFERCRYPACRFQRRHGHPFAPKLVNVTVDFHVDGRKLFMTPTCWICGAVPDTGGCEPLVRVVCRRCGQKNLLQRNFDHFVPVETLGAGGMGTVYKASKMQLERFNSLKL